MSRSVMRSTSQDELYDPIVPATSAKRRMQSHDTEDIAHRLFLIYPTGRDRLDMCKGEVNERRNTRYPG